MLSCSGFESNVPCLRNSLFHYEKGTVKTFPTSDINSIFGQTERFLPRFSPAAKRPAANYVSYLNNKRWKISLDKFFGSGIFIRSPDRNFFNSGSRVKKIRIRIKKLGCSFRIQIFFHPGSRGQNSTVSPIQIRNTCLDHHKQFLLSV